MKRAEALQELSREHNHALLLARTARRAAASGDAAAVARSWASLAQAFRTGMAAHFDTEEAVVLPLLRALGAEDLAERLLREHRAIRRTLDDPGRRDATRLAALADVLRAHVRREEREAFPLSRNGSRMRIWPGSPGSEPFCSNAALPRGSGPPGRAQRPRPAWLGTWPS